ncbi:MAG: pilus assembly protein TadG-related protein [Acidobacteriaceae bacterium]
MWNEKRSAKVSGKIFAVSAARMEGGETGQIMVSLLLMLSIFLLAMVGFAVDLTNLWFHRQAAQTAADSACQAGAMDMAALAAGMALPNMGFTPGTSANCSTGAGTICFYANANGYNGAGLSPGSPSNSVAWSFPSSVPNVTTPPGTITSYPFLKVVVTENVKTHFLYTIHGTSYQQVAASCTCGTTQIPEAAPMIVLNTSASGAFTYSGGGNLTIVGGPQRALQVNSTSPTAIDCIPSGLIDTSHGGPKGTGSSVGISGGPSQAPTTCWGGGFNGGTTGGWTGGALPVGDPYAGVAAPASVKQISPLSTTNGIFVTKAASGKAGADGCPDPSNNCIELAPGYYPAGISTDGWHTYIFLPGIYYLGGALKSGGSSTLRMATPCSPTCSSISSTMAQQTDGLMFYFLAGSINISGCSGCSNSDLPVPSTALTCDGSAPAAALNMPSTLNGNILVGQCTANGTYWDAGGDTTDSRGAPGSRGLLFYQDHGDAIQPQFTGSGALTFSGALYFHSAGYSDVLSLNGGASTGTFVLGQIVADQVSLTGSGAIKMALNPMPSTPLLKVGMLQ